MTFCGFIQVDSTKVLSANWAAIVAVSAGSVHSWSLKEHTQLKDGCLKVLLRRMHRKGTTSSTSLTGRLKSSLVKWVETSHQIMRPKMSSLVDQTEKFQFVEPSPSVLKHSSLLHNIFRMSLKPGKGSTLSALFPPHRKLSGAYRMHHGCSSLATVLLFLLCTSSLLVGASLRHSSSSLLNLIGLQQSPAVASFGPSSGAASLSTSSQSLLSSTSSNAKLLNGKWQKWRKSVFFLWKLG